MSADTLAVVALLVVAVLGLLLAWAAIAELRLRRVETLRKLTLNSLYGRMAQHPPTDRTEEFTHDDP